MLSMLCVLYIETGVIVQTIYSFGYNVLETFLLPGRNSMHQQVKIIKAPTGVGLSEEDLNKITRGEEGWYLHSVEFALGSRGPGIQQAVFVRVYEEPRLGLAQKLRVVSEADKEIVQLPVAAVPMMH